MPTKQPTAIPANCPFERPEKQLLYQWEPLARQLARRFAGPVECEDLEQVARIALWQSAQRFDPSRGCQFTTFAVPTIVGTLQRYLRDQGMVMHTRRRWWDLRPALNTATEALTVSLGQEPTVAELAAHLGVSEEDVLGSMSIQYLMHPASLDERRTGADGTDGAALGDRLGANDPELEGLDDRIVIRSALERLPPILQEVLERRFLQDLPRREVARQLHVSQMRISRLERQGAVWLRQILHEPFDAGQKRLRTPNERNLTLLADFVSRRRSPSKV